MFKSLAIGLIATAFGLAAPAAAQVKTIDPNTAAAQSDVTPLPGERGTAVSPPTAPPAPTPPTDMPMTPPQAVPSNMEAPPASTLATQKTATYRKDDLIGAAEGVFGKGAAGLAGIIEDLLRKQGEPNGYIVGREGGGAIVFGLRYGSGTLHHKIEGEKPVYWTGPSVGFDAGANAASSFVLVYNLFDTEDLFKRFGAGEGQAYLVGGFHVSYMRRGDIVLIPVRSGAGLRLGINAGYMKFSHKQNWLPF